MQEKYKSLVHFIKHDLAPGKEFIPLHEPLFVGNEKAYLNDAIDSGFVSSVGAYVNRFEEEFAAYTGASFAVATTNGTSALHIALIMAGVQPEEEVITQAVTFIATANAIQYAGAHPVFLDIEKDRLTLSPEELASFLSEQTELRNDGYSYNKLTGKRIAACLPVHIFGMMANMGAINEVCAQHNIPVVEDAAESLGSSWNGIHSGRFGKLGAFSFNGNKIITSGGGGAIITEDEEIAKAAKHITTTAKVKHPWKYIHDQIGYNYRMPNINAALLCAQLEQLPAFLDKKKILADRYHELFHTLDIDYVQARIGEVPNNWLIHLLTAGEQERDEFLEFTNNSGVMTRPLWNLMIELDMYKECQSTSLRNSKDLAQRLVNLPSSANL